MRFMEIIKEYCVKYGIDMYMVGGAVRDCFLKRDISDYDFVLNGDAHEAALYLAEALEGTYVNMHEDIGRVVAKGTIFDFGRLKGEDICRDLGKRDFTINSIAIEIKNGSIIDINNGKSDMEKKVIRVVYPMAFDDDPVRMMRAVRLAGKLGFNIDENTKELINKKAALIRDTAGERILEELLKIFEMENSSVYIKLLFELGLFEKIFFMLSETELKFNSAEYLRCLEENMYKFYETKWGYEIKEHLNQKVNGRSRSASLKLGYLLGSIFNIRLIHMSGEEFHRYKEDMAHKLEKLSLRLMLSNEQKSMVNDIAMEYSSMLALIEKGIIDSVTYSSFMKLRDNSIDLLISLTYNILKESYAVGEKSKYYDFILLLIDRYFSTKKLHGKLVTGVDVIEITGRRGKEVGETLNKIDEEIFCGNIKNRGEALNFLKQIKR